MDPFDLTASELAGFRLVRRLGSGGMATVYEGENTLQPSILRAIKVIHPTLSVEPEFLRRFADEARNLERLTHPNVVRFHGLRRDGSRYFMELELLSGRTLAEVLAAGPLSIEQVVAWIRQAAAGVAAAHSLGIVHRDLKPENLFLTDDGTIKVLDFGVARARDEAERATRVTIAGAVVGTAGYLAPEGWATGDVGPPADVYALGLTLAELLLGHHPFMPPDQPRPSRVQLMHAHLTLGVPDLGATRPDVPPWVRAVVATATAVDPKARFTDAAALERALSLAEASAEVPPAPVTEPLRSFTELRLPTLAVSQQPPVVVGVSGAAGGRSWLPWLLVGGALVVACLAAMTIAGAVVVKGLPAGAAGATLVAIDNPWVPVIPPAEPVVLGLADHDGVGFWPEANVRSPLVPYALQQHEVTWGELEPWLGAHPEHAVAVPDGGEPAAWAGLPATGIPWTVADGYCRSLGDDVALPTEEQWEFAARGEALRPWPWGDRPLDPSRTHAFRGADAVVRTAMTSPQDRTPGPTPIHDLAGNAREWTADPFRVGTTGATPPLASDGAQLLGVIRGLPLRARLPSPPPRTGAAWRHPLCGSGTCMDEPTLDGQSVAEELRDVGFRCARDSLP